MKKAKGNATRSPQKTVGTRIVEKYRSKMNNLTEAERKQLLQEGLATIYGAPAEPGHAHRR
jgi:hypothetical protein